MAQTERRGPPHLVRRLLIFVLIGVPLGGMLLMLSLPVVMNGNLDLGSVFTEPAMLPALVLLPPFWFVGTVPALFCGALDAKLAGTALAQPWRALLVGALGGALMLLPLLGLYAFGSINGPLPLVLTLAGVGAATTCSVLSALADKVGSEKDAA
jgi:hypothetical protein